MLSSKKLTCNEPLRQVFIKNCILDIHSDILVFRSSFVNCCLFNLISGSTIPSSLSTPSLCE